MTRWNSGWNEFVGVRPKPAKVIRRLIDLPGIRELENDLLLAHRAGFQGSHPVESRVIELSKQYFGICYLDVKTSLPAEFKQIEKADPWEAERLENQLRQRELQYFCRVEHTVEQQNFYLKSLGWDLTDERGMPIRLFDRFARVLEVCAKGLKGHLPNFKEIELHRWEASIADDARQHMAEKRKRASHNH